MQSTDPSLMLAAGNAQHLCKSGPTHMLPSTCTIRNVQPVLRVFWHCTFDMHCLSASPGHMHCIVSKQGKGSTKIRLNPCSPTTVLMYEEQNRKSVPKSRLWHEQREGELRLQRQWTQIPVSTTQVDFTYQLLIWLLLPIKVKCIFLCNNVRNILTRFTKALPYSFLQFFRDSQKLDGMVNTCGCGGLAKPIDASCFLFKNSDTSKI